MKHYIALFLIFLILLQIAGCGSASEIRNGLDTSASISEDTTKTPSTNNPEKNGPVETDASIDRTINFYCQSNEVYSIIMRYKELHPEFTYKIMINSIATADGSYYVALDEALEADGEQMADFYSVESAEMERYTRGKMAQYATPYKDLGIDVDVLLEEADIYPYVIDIGTNTDGQIVALGYQGTGSAFIYRRSIAKAVWGTDDPEIIKDKIGPGWDKFLMAADELKAGGYAIVSGYDDIWYPIVASAERPWVVDGKLRIDPDREIFLDLAKQLYDNGYTNNTATWTEGWYNGMRDDGTKKVFGYFGPSWMVNNVIKRECGGENPGEGTYGDWAVCEPPAPFFWGGVWVFVNKNSEHKEVLGDLIRWITLDSSETGFQYSWANGTFEGNGGERDAVISGTVMKNVSGKIDFVGGQNMFDVFDRTARLSNGKNRTQYGVYIDSLWLAATRDYVEGRKTREQAILDFKKQVKDALEIAAE